VAAEFIIEHLSPEKLTAHPLNWGKHSTRQKDALAASLGKHGWLAAPIWNKRTGHLLDGHARVEHARNVGTEKIPVRVVDVSEEQERQILASFDRISELRERDDTALCALLRQVVEESHDAPDGFSKEEVGSLMLALGGTADPEAFGMDGEGRAPDPDAEWTGMPSFEQENQLSKLSVLVNFKTEADVEAFEALVEQSIPKRSHQRSIWYPRAEIEHVEHLGYVSSES
jgi:hypothetical protein